MLKKVIKSVFYQSEYSRRGHGHVEHFLECGCTRREKSSYGYPKKMQCKGKYGTGPSCGAPVVGAGEPPRSDAEAGGSRTTRDQSPKLDK